MSKSIFISPADRKAMRDMWIEMRPYRGNTPPPIEVLERCATLARDMNNRYSYRAIERLMAAIEKEDQKGTL